MPQENSIVERTIRIITGAMLRYNKNAALELLQSEAVNRTVHILNTTTLNQTNSIPAYEKCPKIKLLKVFECTAFMSIPN